MHDGLAEILLYACIPLAFAAVFVVAVWVVQLRLLRRRNWSERPRRVVLYRGPLAIALVVMGFGLGASVYYADAMLAAAGTDAQQHFREQTDKVENDVRERMSESARLLDGVRGLLLTQREISAAEFGAFANAKEVSLAYPVVRDVGFIARVLRSDSAAVQAQQRRLGQSGFQLRTSGTQPDLFVIQYIEPLSRNQEAIGYDIGAEPLRRAAAEAAMRSGHPALTRPITLVQDPRKRPAALYLLPVYGSVATPETEEQRVRALRGWAYAPVVFAELLAGIKDMDADSLSFELFDSPDLAQRGLVYDSRRPDGSVTPASAGDADLAAAPKYRYSVVRPIWLVDQVYYLRTVSSAKFDARFHTGAQLQAVVQGAALSVLAAMVLWLLMVGRARAMDLAEGMTSELDRLAMVARRTSNAVYFTDTDWRITWVNEGFTRMSGFSAGEALGLRPSELLHSPLADPTIPETIDQLAESGNRVEIQVLQRNKNGQDYWIELEILPISSAQGTVTGYLSVQSDITEKVLAQAALLLEKERAETILTGTNVGTWESNLLTGEQRWNDRWGAMLGFARDEVVPSADAFWQQRMHPGDRLRLNQALADCIAGGTDGYSCEVRALRKDGSWMWVLSRAKVMSRARDGGAEWMGGIHTDITDSKLVELSLRDMEAFLDRAGRIAGLGAWQMDLQTREMVFSAQTCAIHGMAPDFKPTEEVALSFYPEADRARLREAMVQAEHFGTPWDMVLEFSNAQGEQLWVRIFGEAGIGEAGFDDGSPVRLVGAFQDVTKDRLAQMEVERGGVLLRGAIEAINEAFVLFDPQDRLVFCNDKYRAIYDKTSDLLVPGVTFEALVRAGAERGQYLEALGRTEEWITQRVQMHQTGNVALEQRLADGRWLKVMERRMPDGHSVGFRVDITELKLATAEAERIGAKRGEEQRRLQSILDGTNVGTWEWNIQTGESIYSTQYAEMLGYTLEELDPPGYATWVRLVHPDDLVISAARLQEHVSGLRPDYETEVRMQHKQGHWIWVLAKGKLISRLDDGRPLWMYGTNMDINERKLAEQQLAQTTATLQNVLDSATAVGIVTFGLDHRIEIFNKGAENLLGYAAADMLERSCADQLFESSELSAMREGLELAWGRALEPLDAFAHLATIREEQEWSLVRKNGSRFRANLIFSPMHDMQGVQVGNLCMIYDVSRQKEYESSLRDAMRLAEQSSVAKSQFLANMSHEIRTPMNAILGMLQLLRNTALNGNQSDYAEKAAGAARSLLGLLNDILDFSKVEAGKMQLNPEPFLLESLLVDLSVILSSNLGAKNVDLVFDVDPAIPPELVGDAMRLKQILINLGGNAVKFTEAGQVVVRWKLLARTPERVKLEVAVIDTGIGIAQQNQARIFSAFSQAEANTTRRFGGTGLGLVISTRLVRLMGSELELSSVEGQGSTFSFTLDLGLADRSSEVVTALAVARPPSVPVRAMVVDDNPQALTSSAAMMASLGWQVSQAANGEEALALLKASLDAGWATPEVLFVDWHMPDMDGWDTLRNARRLFGSAKPPLFVLLSRQSREALAQRTGREQELLSGLMVKPFTAAMFERALARALDGSASVQPRANEPTRRLYGMRVLLVEDNRINQQVAQELLSAEGAVITLADNGALGVAAVQNASAGAGRGVGFDAVLMDLQMPVMDGLSATRLLRADARFAKLPVIAMTANAMQSDREDCLAAGMNDHIGKPFDLNRLVQTLVQHTHWVSRAGTTPAAAAALPQTGLAWPEGLEVDLALARMGGNKGLLQRSINAFASYARALPQRLQQGLQTGDLDLLKGEWHAVKGLAATVGVPALSDLAGQAEKAVQDPQRRDDYLALVQRFEQRLAALLPGLDGVARALVDATTVTPPHRMLDAAALQQLKALLVALQACDMSAMEMHAQLRQSLDDTLGATMEPLDAAISELEFEAAALACERLMQQFEATDTTTDTQANQPA